MHSPLKNHPWISATVPVLTALVVSAGLGGCNEVSTNAFEATADFQAAATTTYTWQVEYVPRGVNRDRPNDRRLEQFETSSITNLNGIRPEAAGSGPDNKGLWWPPLPLEPNVDDIESRQLQGETARLPEVIKSVDYVITFDHGGQSQTLPTRYDVYRQAVKAFEQDRPLALTLGPQDKSVLKAEIQ